MPKAAKKTTEKEEIPKDIFDGNADERRLFYVALTRAKESVTITYAREDDTKRETLPSQFIGELKSDLVEKLDTTEWEERAKSDLGFQYQAAKSKPEGEESHSLKDAVFVRELFQKQGFSPTALNNYLECPWKYFYQNLIRIPYVQNKHMLYGTAIHAAISDFMNQMKRELVGKSFLLAAFERHMNMQPFDPRDVDEARAKGERALGGWYDAYENSWNMRAQIEYRINGIEVGNGIRLTGVLDRIEWNDDDSVTVIDYKTGKPKSRNEIAGKTKSSDGNYYRQLTFYKLLLKYFREGNTYMSEGVIDFIEPDDKGKYHREVFEITDAEVSELEETVIRVAEEITTLSFWDARCGEKDCEYCNLRDLMQSQ